MRRNKSKKTRRVSNKLKQRMKQPTITLEDFVKKVSKSKTTKKNEFQSPKLI